MADFTIKIKIDDRTLPEAISGLELSFEKGKDEQILDYLTRIVQEFLSDNAQEGMNQIARRLIPNADPGITTSEGIINETKL